MFRGDLSAEKEEEFQSILKFKTKWAKALREVQKQKKAAASTLQTSERPAPRIIEEIPEPNCLKERMQGPFNTSPLIQEIPNSPTATPVGATISIEEKMGSLSMDCGAARQIQQKIHPLLEFTEKENEAMVALPRKEFVLDKEESRVLYLGLVDLILSYSYENRVMQGEFSVESSWTIGKLCSSMACLEVRLWCVDITCSRQPCLRANLIHCLGVFYPLRSPGGSSPSCSKLSAVSPFRAGPKGCPGHCHSL